MVTLEEILASPELPRWHRLIGDTLQQERARRARFQEEVSPDQKAEFINGEVILHSPARNRHSEVSARMVILLGAFVEKGNLGTVRSEKVLVSLERNDYEPDVLFYGREKAAAFTPDQMFFPAPDLAVEILSPSTEARDRGIKMADYAAHGVGEYWIIEADTPRVEQYLLDPAATTYRLAGHFGPGQVLRSVAVPGFAVPVDAFFDQSAFRAALP